MLAMRSRKSILCCAFLLIILQLSSTAGSRGEEEKLIGWQGESYHTAHNEADRLPRLETISWSPRVFVYHNFASQEEVKHLMKVAAPQMRRSQVVEDVSNSDNGTIDDYRTSYGCFVRRYYDHTVAKIQQRVAEWVHLPVVHQEDMQVLRYGVGQKYGAHLDSLDDDSPRSATVLIYLKDAEFGGETSFPATTSQSWVNPERGAELEKEFSDCAKGHVAFRPKAGDALLFWSIKPDGKTEDPKSEHEGCPVIKGVKWTATVWVHPVPFRPESFRNDEEEELDPGFCEDVDPKCKRWANRGDCESNKEFMLGDLDNVGSCRKACKACDVCDKNDVECYNRNRLKAGFLVYDPAEFEDE